MLSDLAHVTQPWNRLVKEAELEPGLLPSGFCWCEGGARRRWGSLGEKEWTQLRKRLRQKEKQPDHLKSHLAFTWV